MGRRSNKNNRRKKGGKKNGKRNGSQRSKRRRLIPPERYIMKKVRTEVMDRDNYRCVYCNRKASKKLPLLKMIKLEFGHVIQHSKGGDRCVDNIQMECFDCNRSKGASRKDVSWFKEHVQGRGAKGCRRHN